VLKTTAGALAGGFLLGLRFALFVILNIGGGWRSASVAAGIGVGLGSSLPRTRKVKIKVDEEQNDGYVADTQENPRLDTELNLL
jgi:hypothetical protein